LGKFSFFDDIIGPWTLTVKSNLIFLFKKNLGKIRIFRALDWASSVCGSKIMAEKTQINYLPSDPLTTACATLPQYNSPAG